MILIKSARVLTIVLFLFSKIDTQCKDNYDVLHYDNSIAISDTTDKIFGKTVITIKLNNFTNKLSVNFKYLNIDSIRCFNKHLKFVHMNDLIEIDNPIIDMSTDTIKIIINYSGIPKDGLIIKKNKYGRRTFFADNWPNRAQCWFPCKDVLTDKATVSFHITAPNKYMVVANGSLTRRKNNLNNTSTTSYEETVDIPTYCMVFGAAEFDIIHKSKPGNIPVSIWIYPEDYEDGIYEFKRVYDIIDYYSTRFGKFPYSKLALVQSSTVYGGMENAGAIFFAEESIGRSSSIETTIAHEIVHQWFGDYVTERKWTHLWLSDILQYSISNTQREKLFFIII